MLGGIRNVAKLLWLAKVHLLDRVTRPFRINYDVLVAHNAASLRSLTRRIGENHPGIARAVDHALGFDRCYFAGPAGIGRPGTVLGRLVCGVGPPIMPLLIFVPATGLATFGNWAIKHWPWIGEMMDGEFRRRQKHHKKAVQRTVTRRALVEVRAVAGPDAPPPSTPPPPQARTLQPANVRRAVVSLGGRPAPALQRVIE